VKALILSGGGSRGAYEAGVLSALAREERFEIVCGTSVGAINGGAVAQGEAERLPDLWRGFVKRKMVRLRPEIDVLVKLWNELRSAMRDPAQDKAAHLWRIIQSLPHLRHAHHLFDVHSLFDGANVRASVEEYANFAALRTTFIVGVTNLSIARGSSFAYFPPERAAEREAFFAIERDANALTAENYADAICASAALSPIFEPLRIRCGDGVTRVFADGGFTNNAPIRQAIDAGATEVTAIFVEPPKSVASEHEISTVAHIAPLVLEANASRMLELDLKLAERINADVLAGVAPGKRYVKLRIIGPEQPLELPFLNFEDIDAIEMLFERGRIDGMRALEAEAV